jgi:hypothetical protein
VAAAHLVSVAAVALGLWTPARAEVAASLSLQSDDRLRGVSVSDRRPVLSLNLADDFANGLYVGGSAIAQQTPGGQAGRLGHTEYVGYAARGSGGLVWDVGLDNQDLRVMTAKPVRLRYSEVYGGVSKDDLSARIYYSPNYLRPGLSVVYAEINRTLRPNDDWRLSGHLGAFQPLGGNSGTTVRRSRYDVRFDVVRLYRRAEFDLGWAMASPPAAPEPHRSHGGLVAGVTLAF